MTSSDQYKFISTLVKEEMPEICIQFIHQLDLLTLLPSQLYWLLDLDFISDAQLQEFFRQRASDSFVIGFSKQPEAFEDLIESKDIITLLHIPFDMKDLALNAWVGSSFLIALKQTLMQIGFQSSQEVERQFSNKRDAMSIDNKIVKFSDFRK